jgi:hypothetical protein
MQWQWRTVTLNVMGIGTLIAGAILCNIASQNIREAQAARTEAETIKANAEKSAKDSADMMITAEQAIRDANAIQAQAAKILEQNKAAK